MRPVATRHRSARAGSLRSSAIRDLLSLTTRPDVLSLAGGLPDPASLPRAEVAAAAARLADRRDALQYGPTEGDERLREWIASYESSWCRRPVAPDEVLVTAGAQQALFLLLLALADPGDPVLVEEPGYVGALQAVGAAGAEAVAVRVGPAGLDLDRLDATFEAGVPAKVLVTTTTFSNPCGATLGGDGRARLAALAGRRDLLVIDDDPYRELWFGTPPPPPMRAFTDRAVHLGSTSKILAPGLRVGWLVGPADLVHDVARLKQAADLQTATYTQALAAELLTERGWLATHTQRLRATYAERCAALGAALEAELGDTVAGTAPCGGLFRWCHFTDGTDTESLLAVALEEGVGFVPGQAFATLGTDRRSLRLSFGTLAPADLHEAVRRLGVAHRRHRARRARASDTRPGDHPS